MANSKTLQKDTNKLVSTNELIFFLMGTFFLTTMTGMCGSYRQAYLINILGLELYVQP